MYKLSMYKSQCMIHSMMLHSFQNNAHALLSLLVFKHGFVQMRLGIFDFFAFALWVTNTIYYYQILQENTILFIDEKRTQWNLNIKDKSISWKYFMFHEMALKLYFMKCPERKFLQSIFAWRSFSKCKKCICFIYNVS